MNVFRTKQTNATDWNCILWPTSTGSISSTGVEVLFFYLCMYICLRNANTFDFFFSFILLLKTNKTKLSDNLDTKYISTVQIRSSWQSYHHITQLIVVKREVGRRLLGLGRGRERHANCLATTPQTRQDYPCLLSRR